MEKEKNDYGYAPDGTPINYVDDEGILWIYQGKGEDGGDSWEGCY